MVVKVECTHLSFRWIRTEVVLFIVWSKVVESIGETFYDNAEVTMLSSYTKVAAYMKRRVSSLRGWSMV